MTDLSRRGAIELSAGYADRSVSPVEATQAALAAIEAYEDQVNAFVLVDADGALAAARESEERWTRGDQLSPFDGVPTPVKENLYTVGLQTTKCSRLVDPAGPWEFDSPVVARMRESGAVFLGKTTLPEFAWKGVTDSPLRGATGNAWDPAKTSGGSSGGSATAVALGMGAWAVGTDGGGSVRIPGSFSGLVALKPTYGLIPMFPPSPFGTLSHGGPMTRSVEEAAAMLDILVGFDARDWSAMPTPTGSFRQTLSGDLSGMRIAYSAALGFVDNDPEVDAACRRAVEVLADAGATVEEADPGFADPLEAFWILWSAGAVKVVEPYGEDALEQIDPGLRRSIEYGKTLSASDYLDAVATRMDLGVLMGAFHERYDLLVTPTMPIPAFAKGQDAPDGWPAQQRGEDWVRWTPYSYPFNLTQQPALTVPCGFTESGLPIGLQIVGARHDDARVLRAGYAFDVRTDWSDRTPPLVQRTFNR